MDDAEKKARYRKLYKHYRDETDEECERQRKEARRIVMSGQGSSYVHKAQMLVLNRVVRGRQQRKRRREFLAELTGWVVLLGTFGGGVAATLLGKYVARWLGWWPRSLADLGSAVLSHIIAGIIELATEGQRSTHVLTHGCDALRGQMRMPPRLHRGCSKAASDAE
jgi:hypothetical protein